MSRTGEFVVAAGRRSALNRASGFGQTGKERAGRKGFGYLVKGSSVEVGDHLMGGDDTVRRVTHLSHPFMTEKTAMLHDGTTQLIQPNVHYSVGDSEDHYPKKQR